MDLTDEQWEVLAPLIPDPPRRADGKGRPWRDPRDVLNGVLWILRTGAPWHDLPDERYPPYQTCHRRFQRWHEEGVLEGVLRAPAEDLKEWGGLDLSECFVDATFAGAKRGAASGKDRAGQGHEARGAGRPLWSSSLRSHGERFWARGHPRRGCPRGELPGGAARAADRGPGLRLRPAGRGPPRKRHRDDRPASEGPQEEKDPGRAQAQALQEAPEGRAAVRVA